MVNSSVGGRFFDSSIPSVGAAARGTGRYSRNFHPGVRYLSAYWHFLDVIWVLLFLVIYF